MNRIEVEKKVLNENQILAEQLRERYRQLGVLCINLISAPGSGKTALLERTLQRMDKGSRVAVLTGDLQTENDAQRLAKFGFPVKQITTGGTCHLDAKMIGKHLEDWKLEDLDLLIVENVGNLVCPSSYDLGEDAKIVLLSTTEGEDKPLKYPSIFFKSELMLLTKIDLLPYVPFKADVARENARRVHPQMEIIDVSSTTGEGLDRWMEWLQARQERAKAKLQTLQSYLTGTWQREPLGPLVRRACPVLHRRHPSTDTMGVMSLVRYLMLLSLVIWIGGLIFFAFVLAPTVFAVLPTRQLAGNVVNRSLGIMHWMAISCGVVFAVTSMIDSRIVNGVVDPFAARNLLIYAMIILTLVGMFGIASRMLVLRQQMGIIDDVPQDDARRVEFNRLHVWSTRIEGSVLVLGLALLFLTARRMT